MSTCRLHRRGPRPEPGLLERCRELPTSILSDSMERVGGLRGLHAVPGARWPRVAGPALTVRTRPGDNLVVHRALDLGESGDVLVVDAGGYLERAIIGEIMGRYAVTRGLAALVVDGAVRDAEGLAAGPIPVFALGINHLGPYKDGPGEIHGPVSVGGTVVRSGDVVVGDGDGVVVVPHERAAEVAALGATRLRSEEEQFAQIVAGTLDRSWVLQSLTETSVAEEVPR
ncbi:MAG: dimethylmenaquinone methyltransferase [Actinomycetota bacterium]|nr:dimethylmenaquinone methyltransferase [Actinomycetota bacterium]